MQLRQQNITQMLSETTGKFPQHLAVRGAGVRWTYAQLYEAVEQMARSFCALSITAQSHVALWTEPSPRSVTAFFALQRIGAIAIMLNTCLKGRELEKQLCASEAEYVLVEDPDRRLALVAASQSGSNLSLEDNQNSVEGAVGARIVVLSELPEGMEPLPPVPAPEPGLPALMLFTSGTTSADYKVVCSSGVQLANSGRMKAEDMRITEKDVICSALPMFHTFCINCNILAAAASGACLVLPPDRHSKTLLSYIADCGCTILTAVPSVYLTLAAQQPLPDQVSSLRCGIVGGAYCPPEQFRAIEQALGMTLLPGLGQTEVIGGITIASPDESLEVRATTLGHFVNRLEGRIVSDGRPISGDTRRIGEIQVRGPMIMLGYYKNGRVEPAADADEWFHTGDLAWEDADGNLHYAGRIKDIIIRGGENIMPSELEQTLSGERGIACCKAVGVPDAHYGEVPCMCIVPREGETLSGQEVLSVMSKRLAAFKLPRYVLFFDQFPYTNTGKINCKKLSLLAERTIQEQTAPAK